MTEYTVDIHIKGRYDKPVTATTIKEARRIACDMLLNGGLTTNKRYNYVEIYEGKMSKGSRPKYIVKATNYYGGKVNPYWTTFSVETKGGVVGWKDLHVLYTDGSIKRRA